MTTRPRARHDPSVEGRPLPPWLHVAAGCALVIAAGVAARLQWWTTDDAFISFRYAENLVRGLGLVFNQGSFGPVGRLKRHSQASLTKRQAVLIERTVFEATSANKGDGGKAAGLIEVFVDIESVKSGIEGATRRFMA